MTVTNPSHAVVCIARRLSFRGFRWFFLDAKPCIKALLPCLSRRYVVGGRSPLVPFFRPESLFSSEHPGTDELIARCRRAFRSTRAVFAVMSAARPLFHLKRKSTRDLAMQEATYAVQQIAAYSITPSARASNVGGTVRPSIRAV